MNAIPAGFVAVTSVSCGNAVATPAIALDLVPQPCEKYPLVANASVGTDAHAITTALNGHFNVPFMCEKSSSRHAA
ncbi:hypothetical protein [Thiocapsa sp.]|uniref:hypothetical protein n=1 Tax=Thiocapsa sp. TaxID=2024551 RepID=UPI002617236A|nr:hypothetical protein [Thiocapsa sp.]